MRRGILVWVLGFAIVAAISASFVVFRASGTTTVPSVVGLDVDAASAEILAAGLCVEHREIGVGDGLAPEGTVTAQEPAAGTEVDEGSVAGIRGTDPSDPGFVEPACP